MERLARRLWRRMGAWYFALHVVFDFVSAYTIAAATIALLWLYQDMTAREFALIVGVLWTCITVAIVIGWYHRRDAFRTLIRWARGPRARADAPDAWRAAVSFPIEVMSSTIWLPLVMVAVPGAVFTTVLLGLPWYGGLVVTAGGVVAIAYSAVLHFFASEMALRPVVRDIARDLPPDFIGKGTGVSLRVKLLAALPLINVVTGVVVSGLSTSERASLEDLGLDVIVALLVSFTLSLELTLLVTKSILGPVRDLLDSTERVTEGDLSTRVPVLSGDELGDLACSFNEMVAGLEEREALREAFGSYVAPEVTERVLSEGQILAGEDVELTVMFVDMRNFTAFAERSSARETVARLNEFFDLIVPLLVEHGGHANKFIGDGVLGVFGAPTRLRDHARRAVDAACAIAQAIEDRFGGELAVGIGINSGPASVGSIGGGGRLEFTVIGDTVNVASRVERLTRETGDTILLTESTRALLDAGETDLEARGEVEIRGRVDPVPVYAPVALTPAAR
jgi:class 3 adenylate cyclase